MTEKLPSKKSGGQILISILIAITVFLILAHALFTLIASSFELVSFNKSRITARHLAQEKIETVRNLVYSDIGTSGGIPAGILQQEENISRNGLNFLIKTDVIYIDDPFDDTAPTDTTPEDYKKVRIEVSWEGIASSNRNPIILITDVSANASSSSDGGTLVILVLDANGNPIPQADVSIVANSISPAVNLTQQTDSNGLVSLPGATPCVSCYEISVTKSGMSSDRTYSVTEVANPLKPHTSVFADDVTQISFAIDSLGEIQITSRDSRTNSFNNLGNVGFKIHGNKIIGTTAGAQPVYKFDLTTTTDGSGLKNLQNMEWDIYHVEMPAISSYDISGTSPVLPLNLIPGNSLDFAFSVEPHTTNSLFLTVKSPSQTLIASASAHLTETGGFDETKFTGEDGNPDFGQTIFSNLSELTYTLQATSSGYLDYNGSFDVSGTANAEVVLTPE